MRPERHTPFTVTITENKTTSFRFENEPMNDPAGITLQKIDADTGEPVSLGAASLEGAQFTIKYYDGYYTKDNLPNEAKRTWVIETKEVTLSDGSIRYICNMDEYFKVSFTIF